MNFIRDDVFDGKCYETYPFSHIVVDNFLQESELYTILQEVCNLKDENATRAFIDPNSPYEYNKYAFSDNYGDYLKNVFAELNSPEFIKKIEKLTGINNIISGDITLRGAGIHRIKQGGYLKNHTDFNSYHLNGVKLDRRINLLIYLNPDWEDHYNGHLCLTDKDTSSCVKKIAPILNRCVIFNTCNRSIHGHPEPLKTPNGVNRHSIAVYYYTKNTTGDIDFEGDLEHCTIFYP
jgi:Rps23 Pro-64 3,4-dihydroxylase Tpa1-like proline 4-hydroxylase